MSKPVNSENTLYIERYSVNILEELVEKAKEYWPEADLARITIDVEEIQVANFGYDQYDPSDYIEYYVLTLS